MSVTEFVDSGDGGGGGSTTETETIDTDQSIAEGEVINDIRGQVAGYDDDVDVGTATIDESDVDIATKDVATGSDSTKGTVIDPDVTNDSTADQVGVTTTEEQVAVTTYDDGGGTSTTVTERGAGDGESVQTTANNQPVGATAESILAQLGIAELVGNATAFLEDNAQTVGAVAAVATLGAVAGVFGGD